MLHTLVSTGWFHVDWLAAHNEHRIALTRLFSATLFTLNGEWDSLVECTFNALLHTIWAASVVLMASRLGLSKVATWALSILLVAGLSIPFAMENTLFGFQSEFYFLLLIAFTLLYVCAQSTHDRLRNYFFISVLGILSLFTIASGVFVCLTGALLLLLRARALLGKEKLRFIFQSAILLLIGIIGFWITPHVVQHETLRAHSISDFTHVFLKALIWPTSAWYGAAIWLPLSVIFVRRTFFFFAKSPTQALASPLEWWTFGIGVFVLLNCAAIAYSRGTAAQVEISSRYTDIVWLSLPVGLLSLNILGSVSRNQLRRPPAFVAFATIAWCVLSVTLLASTLERGLAGAEFRKHWIDQATPVLRTFVALPEMSVLQSVKRDVLPHPSADTLARVLTDPTLKPWLPPSIRLPLHVSWSGTGFSTPGVFPATPLPERLSFGSWTALGDANTGHFESNPVNTRLLDVRFSIAGYLGRPNLTLTLQDVNSDRKSALQPEMPAGKVFVVTQVKAPSTRFKIIATDEATDSQGWFAFTEPVEIGRLREYTERFLSVGLPLFFTAGLALLLLPLGYATKLRREC